MNIRKNKVFIYPLQGKVVFPYHEYTFSIASNLYDPDQYDNLVGFTTKLDDKDSKIEKVDGLSRYGSLLKIHKSDRIFERNRIYTVHYLGLTFARFRISTITKSEGKIVANIQIFSDHLSKEIQKNLERNNLFNHLKKEMKVYYEYKLKHTEADIKKQLLEQEKSLNKAIYRCIDEIDLTLYQKLHLLQMDRQDSKIQWLLNYLIRKTQSIKSVVDLEQKVRQDMKKTPAKKHNPAAFFMGGSNPSDLDEITEKMKEKKLPEHVKAEIEKEIKRMGGDTQKAVALKYINTLLEIPWEEATQDVKDIKLAEKILHEDHTGLLEVKERILEFLAVRFRNGNSRGNIICLHGPPGVGKTSIAKSIAKALNKEFTRISLGGMNDEAELRGHRRTYVAALPGTIVRALIKAKSKNPVILLDEIEKIGKSYKGDPEHALLQILDPSQNSSFVDHYVGIPIDLSKAMFICTANSLNLSTPLLNRLELIEIPGYSRSQQYEIAQMHLIPTQKKQNGVEDLVNFEKQGVQEIIKYCSELGVRQLQRNISKICRKVARTGKSQTICKLRVKEILGKLHKTTLWEGIGVVNGLGWTPLGGKVLIVEALQYSESRPQIRTTGQLGEIMKESVQISLSWIKANFAEFSAAVGHHASIALADKIDDLGKMTLHIHFPQGATKKDGPSAGITIVTCIMSIVLKTPVRKSLAMTGEITLSGKVLPVGGIRQKCLAAIYEGIKDIIVPYDNREDIAKIENNLRQKVHIHCVKQIREVLLIAFPDTLDKIVPKI